MTKVLRILLYFIIFSMPINVKSSTDVYEKIDLFGEVLEKIKKEYVDDVDQSEAIDSAINGVLQSLDPYLLTQLWQCQSSVHPLGASHARISDRRLD